MENIFLVFFLKISVKRNRSGDKLSAWNKGGNLNIELGFQ